MSNKHIAGLLLAGGGGRRLKPDKCWRPVGGTPLINRAGGVLTAVADETIVVGGRRAPAGMRLVPDENPGAGPLWAIHTGMKAIPADIYLVLACDIPFVPVALLEHLLLTSPGFDVVVPIVGERVQPLCAAYSHTCYSAVAAAVERGHRRVVDFFSSVRIRTLAEAEVAQFGPPQVLFFNVNTPEELAQAQRMALQITEGQVIPDNSHQPPDG